MEKFLWNIAGVFMTVASMASMAYCIVNQSAISCVLLFSTIALDLIYARKCPTWVEV